MKTTTIALCLVISLAVINTSEAQEKQKLSKKEKKELKKQEQLKAKKEVVDLLNSRKWVIEAHTVFDRYNQSYQLNPTLNFVGINGEEGAIQLGFDGLIGWNGVGGITLDGKVTQYEVKVGKEKASPTVTLRFRGRGVGSATLFITVNSSKQATARVSGDFGGRITFAGIIKSLEESTVYKGQSLF